MSAFCRRGLPTAKLTAAGAESFRPWLDWSFGGEQDPWFPRVAWLRVAHEDLGTAEKARIMQACPDLVMPLPNPGKAGEVSCCHPGRRLQAAHMT